MNGEKVNHFVILDATTGQIDRTWDVQVQRRNGAAAQVKLCWFRMVTSTLAVTSPM